MNEDRQTDANHNRRMANETRYLNRLEKLEAQAEELIGELCRDGKTVYYITLRNGKTKESHSFSALVDFLTRNHYVG